MELSFSSPSATRLRPLLVLLLLALGLLAGMSVSQSRDVEADVLAHRTVVLPALRRMHDLAARVDEQRGMAALHLTLHSQAERSALEARLQASRAQVERRMATIGPGLLGDADRHHHATVQAGLAAFWAAQDQVLAASRQAAQDPAAAQLARALLAGEAQQAFEQLRHAIEAWWALAEQAAERGADQTAADASQASVVVWAQAMLTALALAVAWALLHLPQRPLQLPPPPADVLDNDAARQHLQALVDAVATARRGEPGRAAGLSATESRHLAEQVDGATRGLRLLIDRPPATAAGSPAAPPDSEGAPPPR
jgi:hypothetical protein